MCQQEFVNRGNITDKIPERTFYNHIIQLKKREYIESEIDESTRRREYSITTKGEKIFKQNLIKNQKAYGDLNSRIQDAKFISKKEIFDNDFERKLALLEQIETKFMKNLADISHFYPTERIERDKDLRTKLNTEKNLRQKLIGDFNDFLKNLKNYKETVDNDLLEKEMNIFYKEEIDSYSFQCPRCSGTNIIEYEKSFDCVDCKLEFDKVSFKLIDDDECILSNEEKKGFLDTFGGFYDKEESNNS